MHSDAATHVILGAGPLGLAVARRLRSEGIAAAIASRSGGLRLDGVEHRQGDITQPDSARALVAGAEVVYCCVGAPYSQWTESFPPLIEGTLVALRDSGARLIYGDNLYMYGPVDGPMTEDLPARPAGPKGEVRARMADRLMRAHAAGDVPVAIGRGSDFFGPEVLRSTLGEQVFAPLLAGRKARLIGDPGLPHTYTFIDDFAAGLVVLGREEAALGEIWHVPSAPTETTREIVEEIARCAGTRPLMQVAGGLTFSILSLFVESLRQLREIRYMYERPFVVDHTKFERAFGASVTSHPKAIAATVEWYRGRGPSSRSSRRGRSAETGRSARPR